MKIDEGNPTDHHTIPCRITLNRVLTDSDEDITIQYKTQDGSFYHMATANVDYTALNGSVTFTTGDIKKTVNIPIIGDTEAENTERIQFVISGSSFINTSSTVTKIWDDDNSFPKLSFDKSTISVIEGNSSQKNLEIKFLLEDNAHALAGSHFSYGTWNHSAEDQWGDNDYIETAGDVNFTGNETSFTIQIPIVGDTKIEPNEVFYIGFWNLDKFNWGTIDQIAITILNDDGDKPAVYFNQNSYSSIEGNSSTKTINFTLSLTKPAIAGSHFDYYTEDGDNSNKALVSDNDYVRINRTTYIFDGGKKYNNTCNY